MPPNKKGAKILEAMQKEYGEEKGKEIFYGSIQKGRISGADPEFEARMKRRKAKK